VPFEIALESHRSQHCSQILKVKLTDEEIPPADDTGAVQPTLLGCELVTPDARKSLRKFFPSIISCILATASTNKPHSHIQLTLLIPAKLKAVTYCPEMPNNLSSLSFIYYYYYYQENARDDIRFLAFFKASTKLSDCF